MTEQMRIQSEKMLEQLWRKRPGQQVKEVAKRLLGRYVAKKDPIFWPVGMLLLGLAEVAEQAPTAQEREGALETCKMYVGAWLRKGAPVVYTDDALTGYVLVRLYELTKDSSYLTAAQKVDAFLTAIPKDTQGSIPYHPELGNMLAYADSAGMTSLFLCAYGTVAKKKESVILGIQQLLLFLQYGMDKASGFPYHAYRVETEEKLGIIGWGRAVGWMLMGLSETLFRFSAFDKADDFSEPEREQLEIQRGTLQEAYQRMVEQIAECCREDGSLSWQLPAMQGPSDTSGTGMILWALERMPAEEEALRNRIATWLKGQIKDGLVQGSLAECVDYGAYPQRYGEYPWGQGAVMAALAKEVV